MATEKNGPEAATTSGSHDSRHNSTTDESSAAEAVGKKTPPFTIDVDYRAPDPVTDGGRRRPVAEDVDLYMFGHMPELTVDDMLAEPERDPKTHELILKDPSWDPKAVPVAISPTDSGNADLLVNYYQQQIRYCPQTRRWLEYNGCHWEVATGDAVAIRAARSVIDGMYPMRASDPVTAIGAEDTPAVKAEKKRNDAAAKTWTAHKLRSQSLRSLKSMVELATKNPLIQIDVRQLDSYPDMLQTPDAVVDLGTGNDYSTDRYWWHTKTTGARHDDNMPPTRWYQFLYETFCGDFDLINYVQQLAGITALGEVKHHVFIYLYGQHGDNGKSVLVEVLTKVLGDYAISMPANFLLAGRDKHETEIARLKGARMAAGAEINAGSTFDEAKVKWLTGGDRLTGRFMHGDFFDFEPTHTLWLMGNHLPHVPAGGNSFWRRMRVIPFNHRVPAEKRIDGLAQQLVDAEGPAILAWIVNGAAEVAECGLMDPPAAVREATGAYAADETEESPFEAFRAECLQAGDATPVERGVMYGLFQKWIADNRDRFDDPHLTQPQFARQLGREANLRTTSRNGYRAYWDIDISPEGLRLLTGAAHESARAEHTLPAREK